MVDASASFRTAGSKVGRPAANRRAALPLDIAVSAASSDVLATYAGLVAGSIAAPAQSAAWIEQWVARVKPDCVVATIRSAGRPVYALVLEVVACGPFRIARFLGGSHANGNFAAGDVDFLASADKSDMLAMTASIKAARPDIDILALERLLPDLAGTRNPVLSLPHFDSPNIALAVDLDGGFDALLARASGKRKRKKHRSQTRKFEAAGGFRRIEAMTPEDTSRLLEAFFAMKEHRFQKMGIANVFGDAGVRGFFHDLFAGALGQSPRPFVLHALEVNGKLRAVTGSSLSGKRLICEFGAIAEDDIAHASPGDFLFFENICEACGRGMTVYDFSVGDEPYKRQWCDIETRQSDVIVALTAKGQALALAMRLTARLKAFVKNSPLVWKIAKLLRKRTAAPPQAAED